jgi:RNA polymerase sigma-70 factor (ECF subfamily)
MSDTATHIPIRAVRSQEAELVAALRRGDERAFVELVDAYGATMLRVAMSYVRNRAVAEEVVQETWCSVLTGIDGFQGRSSFKTWLFRILINRSMNGSDRERRCMPFSAMAGEGGDEAPVSADRFLDADHPRHPGHWAAAPSDWSCLPEQRLLSSEVMRRVRAAIDRLPRRQQQVLVLRDIEGWPTGEICEALSLTETNQRVLLHRGRARVRDELERYFDSEALAA